MKNTHIFHKVQFLLTNVSLVVLSISVKLLPLYQVFIHGTYVFPQLCQFWTDLQAELANNNFYSIDTIRLQFSELQELDPKAQNIKPVEELKES